MPDIESRPAPAVDVHVVLFDLDGTVSDSAPGILGSLRRAFADVGAAPMSARQEAAVLGPPFHESLPPLVGIDLVAPIIDAYRGYYADGGMFDTVAYGGVDELLNGLADRGITLAVATSKPEHFAVPIVEHLGFEKLFATICGDTLDGLRNSKALVVGEVLRRLGHPDPSTVVMIGDRSHDVHGAAEHGLPCYGAGWGYGLPGELETAGAVAVYATPGEFGAQVATLIGGQQLTDHITTDDTEADYPGAEMIGRPARGPARGVGAIALLVLAVVFFVLYQHDNSRENHAFNDGGPPPATVKLTLGQQYEISTPGGMKALLAAGGQPGTLNCNYTAAGGSETRQLDTTALASDTRSVNAVATFVAPVSDMVRVECRALSATYIDDADNSSADPAGFFLLLAVISLTLGIALGMSVLYRRGSTRRLSERDPDDREPDDRDDGDPEAADYRSLLAAPGDSPAP